MFSFMSSSNVLQQATKSWRLLFSETFCCHMKPDTLLSPKRNLSYATFKARTEEHVPSEDVLSSYGDLDEPVNEQLSRPLTLDFVSTIQQEINEDKQDKVIVDQPITPLPTCTVGESPVSPPIVGESPVSPPIVGESPVSPPITPKSSPLRLKISTSSADSLKDKLSPASECSSSGVSSGIMTQPSSMEFSDAFVTDKLEEVEELIEETVAESALIENELSAGSSESALIENELPAESSESQTTQEVPTDDVPAVAADNPAFEAELNPFTTTNDELLTKIDKCQTSLDILDAVVQHRGPVSPLLGVACIHYIYMKALSQFERNSPSYNQLCGAILTNSTFKDMVYTIEANAKSLNNFALLTVASDLLYLRITLKKSTIPTLLSCIDCESLNLDELRLLASCLHTPNFPLINSEYMYNVAGGVAMKHLDDITDLYTLLSIIKCFGRYFTTNAKRHADTRVASFVSELNGTYPDGRLMASHMFDAFYRMEYAPSRPLQLEACKAINASTVPLLPQDVSAILRYFVKYGYNLTNDGLVMLNKISNVLYRHLENEPVSKFTTNVKWLSVFYYYNEPLLERFVDAVKRDMDKLDFVALSDVLDTLAQVYYLPQNPDAFFEDLHNEMMNKYPTLHRSNVKNVQRKILLTAFHFSVFGRYPYHLINLTLSPEQMQANHGLSKHFMGEFCESLRIERPDLLPVTIPQLRNMDFATPKLYAFEKDVRGVLNSVVGSRKFVNASSPVRGLPMFILRQQLDGSILSIKRNTPAFIPPHVHQTIINIAVIPLPRSRYCIGSKHAVGKTRHALRLIRAQGARIVIVPHFEWDGHSFEHKAALLTRKIFEQRTDDVIE